jgi:hypothetical protein
MNWLPNVIRAPRALWVLSLFCLLAWFAPQAHAQSNNGTISGTVSDPSGGVMSGATVTITDQQRGITRTLTTDASGEYNAPNLLPGFYKIVVTATGFKTVARPDVQIEVAQEARLDFTLAPGDASQTVVVTEAAPLVESTNATLGGTLSNETINDLPLNGRNYENLITLRPGVTRYPGGGFSTASTNGLRPEDNVFLLDGLNGDEPFSGQSVINGAPLFGDATTLLPIEGIQEFNTIENPPAEYGWKPGAVINVGMKSGTDSLHGSGFAFGRDAGWDAKNYFIPQELPLALKQFGGSVGGKIIKDKLFFFGAYEGQRFDVGNAYIVNVPTSTSLATPGNPAGDPKNSIPDAIAGVQAAGLPVNPLSQTIAGLFPVNPGTNPLGPTVFSPGLTSNLRLDNFIIKLDYQLNSHNTISGLYFFGDSSGVVNDAPNELAQPWETLVHTRSQVIGTNWVWTPNSTWVNEARFGYQRLYQPTYSVDHTVDPTTYGINTGVTNPLYFGLPQITVNGFAALGALWPKVQGPDQILQFIDHVSYLRGNHAFKFGGELRHNSVTGAAFTGGKGRINFGTNGVEAFPGATPLEDFFAGDPSRGRLLIGDPLRHLTNWQGALFAQDEWRVTKKLTVTYGLRYEIVSVMKDSQNLLGNFDPNIGLVQVGQQISSPWHEDKNNFAPRLGIAWDPKGDGNTVVRAGAGIMYETIPLNTFLIVGNSLGLNTVPTGAIGVTPGGGSIAVGNVNLPGSSLNWSTAGPVFGIANVAINCAANPCNTLAVDPNLRSPYVVNWNLDVQHTFGQNVSLQVAYVGNHATKLLGIFDINQPNLVTGALPFGTQFPYLNFIDRIGNYYESNYNGLQVTVTKRISHGLSFVAGYTYSHALDDSSANWGGFAPQNSLNPGAEYASSDFDIRHRFTLSGTYSLPGRDGYAQMLKGWQLTSIITLQSGQPWTVLDTGNSISGTDETGNPAYGGERWDFSGRPSDFTSGPTPIPFFIATPTDPNPYPAACLAAANTPALMASLNNFGCYAKGVSALTPPAAGTFGTMGRNLFRDSGFRTWDFSVLKNFQIKERFTFQFRAEIFNLLNHPLFANPYGGQNGFGGGAYDDPSAPGLFGCGCATPDVAASNPVVGSGSNRAIQLGLKILF